MTHVKSEEEIRGQQNSAWQSHFIFVQSHLKKRVTSATPMPVVYYKCRNYVVEGLLLAPPPPQVNVPITPLGPVIPCLTETRLKISHIYALLALCNAFLTYGIQFSHTFLA